MHLLELPEELLFRIVDSLDLESLTKFGRVHPRFENVSLVALQDMTVKNPSDAVIEYLREKGSWVHSMDLSHCKLTSGRLRDCVIGCLNLTELNLVNADVPHQDLLRVLVFLDKLEELNFTMEAFGEDHDMVFEECGPFSSIKKVYIESALTLVSCSVVVNFLNKCENIEDVHVSFIGDPDATRAVIVPKLEADRWTKIHTLVCSCRLTGTSVGLHKVFLRKAFAHKAKSKCMDWINESKDCYIYERGFYNGIDPGEKLEEALETVSLLKQYQTVKMVDGESLKTPWGLPSSLRIIAPVDWASELNKINVMEMMSSSLVELDLRQCHGGYTHKFRHSILTSAPSLEVLILPACFFVRSEKDADTSSTGNNSTRNEECEALNGLMQKIKLRKLILKGDRFPDRGCEPCYGSRLTRHNFVDLHEMKHLDEVTLSDVDLDDSVLEKIWNRNLRTLRLEHRGRRDFSFLPDFVRRCSNLENFRVSSYKSLEDCDHVLNAAIAIPKLRRLCLQPRDTTPAPPMLERLAELPHGLEVLHYHLTGDLELENPFSEEVYEALRNLSEARGKKIAFVDNPVSLRSIRCIEMTQSVPGRCLCAVDNGVGSVKAVGWEFD